MQYIQHVLVFDYSDTAEGKVAGDSSRARNSGPSPEIQISQELTSLVVTVAGCVFIWYSIKMSS